MTLFTRALEQTLLVVSAHYDGISSQPGYID